MLTLNALRRAKIKISCYWNTKITFCVDTKGIYGFNNVLQFQLSYVQLFKCPKVSTCTSLNINIRIGKSSIYIIFLVPSLSCGKKTATNNDPQHHRSKRIVGGTEAHPGAFNWKVLIKRKGNKICAGSILSPKFIMSAAHCFGMFCFFH